MESIFGGKFYLAVAFGILFCGFLLWQAEVYKMVARPIHCENDSKCPSGSYCKKLSAGSYVKQCRPYLDMIYN